MSAAAQIWRSVIPPEDAVKVKYGRGNGEVYAEVASSRLLWALGFKADRMYPVRVICRGCPSNIKDTAMATIQRKLPGKDIETRDGSGWAWPGIAEERATVATGIEAVTSATATGAASSV